MLSIGSANDIVVKNHLNINIKGAVLISTKLSICMGHGDVNSSLSSKILLPVLNSFFLEISISRYSSTNNYRRSFNSSSFIKPSANIMDCSTVTSLSCLNEKIHWSLLVGLINSFNFVSSLFF